MSSLLTKNEFLYILSKIENKIESYLEQSMSCIGP